MADRRVISPDDTGFGWIEVADPDVVLVDSLRVPNTLVVPSGTSFPVSPTDGEIFWRTDAQSLYRYNLSVPAWELTNPDPEGVSSSLGSIAFYPHGFVNQTDSTLEFVDGFRQLIVGTISSYDFYYQGTKFTKNNDDDVIISTTTGLHFIYYDATGTLVDSMTPWNLQTTVPVATVYWNNTTGTGFLGEERHMTNMPWTDHYYLHTTVGTRYRTGLALSGYTLNTDTDAGVTFGISTGGVLDEDIPITVTHAATPANEFEQFINDPAKIPVYYRTGANGDWVRDTPTDFYFKNVATGNQLVAWNEYTGGAWQQTELSNAYYVAYWIFATNTWLNPIISIQGQREDNNLTNARTNNTLNTLDLGALPLQEMKLLYRVIVRSSNGYGGTRYAMLTDIADFRAVSTVPGAYVPASHASLGDLATSGHPAAIISPDTTNFDGILSATDTTVQAALETIDNRIFTQATAPTTPANGMLWYNTASGWEMLMAYDTSRTKWLSTAEWTMQFGHDAGDGQLLRGYGVNTPSTGTGLYIPRAACVKRISVRTTSDNNLKQLDLYVNGSSALNFNLVDGTNSSYYKNNAVNLNLAEDDDFWVYVDAAGLGIADVAVSIWCAWRWV